MAAVAEVRQDRKIGLRAESATCTLRFGMEAKSK